MSKETGSASCLFYVFFSVFDTLEKERQKLEALVTWKRQPF